MTLRGLNSSPSRSPAPDFTARRSTACGSASDAKPSESAGAACWARTSLLGLYSPDSTIRCGPSGEGGNQGSIVCPCISPIIHRRTIDPSVSITNQPKSFPFRLPNSHAGREVRHVSTKALLAFLQNNDVIHLGRFYASPFWDLTLSRAGTSDAQPLDAQRRAQRVRCNEGGQWMTSPVQRSLFAQYGQAGHFCPSG
jgi:hypothetical protein